MIGHRMDCNGVRKILPKYLLPGERGVGRRLCVFTVATSDDTTRKDQEGFCLCYCCWFFFSEKNGVVGDFRCRFINGFLHHNKLLVN